MNSRFVVRYHYLVEKHDIPRLSRKWSLRVRHAIETKLTVYPEIFGKPLRNSFAGCRKLRVGDYRIVFDMSELEVRIWLVGHRRHVYELLLKRLGKFLQ